MPYNFTAPVDFRLSQDPPDNLDPETKAAFVEVYNTLQQIFDTFVTLCGIGSQSYELWSELAGSTSTLLAGNLNRLYVKTDEAIQVGAAVAFKDVGGELRVINANAADNTKVCRGFSAGPQTNAANQFIEVIIHSGKVAISGLTIGRSYYLSTSNGQIQNVAPTGTGNIQQYLGFAVSPTVLAFNINSFTQL
jgi:hypothetical protein